MCSLLLDKYPTSTSMGYDYLKSYKQNSACRWWHFCIKACEALLVRLLLGIILMCLLGISTVGLLYSEKYILTVKPTAPEKASINVKAVLSLSEADQHITKPVCCSWHCYKFFIPTKWLFNVQRNSRSKFLQSVIFFLMFISCVNIFQA